MNIIPDLYLYKLLRVLLRQAHAQVFVRVPVALLVTVSSAIRFSGDKDHLTHALSLIGPTIFPLLVKKVTKSDLLVSYTHPCDLA